MKCGKCGREVRPGPNRYWHSRKKWCHQVCPKRKGRKKAVRVRTKGVDADLTAHLHIVGGLTDSRSRVMLDGREILYGLDYTRRLREVQTRSGYKCEAPTYSLLLRDAGKPPFRCGAPSCGHPHHIVKRSKGRDDRLENLMDVCSYHASAVHPELQTRFTTSAEKRKAEEDFNALYPKGETT
jgi:hypothetical protein